MQEKKLSQVKKGIEQHQIDAVKAMVQVTLDVIHEEEQAKQVIQDRLKALKHDLTDMKEGRLDRIVERHELSEKARDGSVFDIHPLKEQQTSKTHWYDEYCVKIKDEANTEYTVNNSLCKIYSPGSYKLKDDTIKYA